MGGNTVLPTPALIRKPYEDDNNLDMPPRIVEADSIPTALDAEEYDNDPNRKRSYHPANNVGPLERFANGLRTMWATKQTMNVENDRRLYVETTVRELFVYSLFLIVTTIVAFSITGTTLFYYGNALNTLFVSTTSNSTPKTFDSLSEMDDIWSYLQGTLMDGLYLNDYLTEMGNTDPGLIYYENHLLGVPRIRMLRVRNDSCTVVDSFIREITQCYGPYDESIEDRDSFGLINGTAWNYASAEQLGTLPVWGQISTYGGGGFVLDLDYNDRKKSMDAIGQLMANRWIDRGTRAIIIDFILYNANVNLFCVIQLLIELPASGGVMTSNWFNVMRLINYVTAYDYYILTLQAIFCAFFLYYLVEELLELARWRLSYLKKVWNLLDLLVLTASGFAIYFNISRTWVISRQLTTILTAPIATFANLYETTFINACYVNSIAVLVFLAWIKIFKYISFNKTMTQLSATLSRSAKDIGGFAVMFCIFFFAYAQFGFMIFGTQIKDYSTFCDAVFALFRTILGDFNFQDLQTANRILGPVFFISYVFFVFFVLLNMFLAIINDTYVEVKGEMTKQKSKLEVSDHIKQLYHKLLRRLRLTKKIDEIDPRQEYGEWRKQLRSCGYSDEAINEAFIKYNIEGDRLVTAEERDRVQSALSGGTAQQVQAVRGDIVSFRDHVILNRRVDRIEESVGLVITKVDEILEQINALEREKVRTLDRRNRLIAESLSELEQDNTKRPESIGE